MKKIKNILHKITSTPYFFMGIFREKLQESQEKFLLKIFGDCFIEFKFKHNHLQINKMFQWETRGDSIIKIIKKVKNKYPSVFPEGEDILITFTDYPKNKLVYNLYKKFFCTTTLNNKNNNQSLSFPCPYSDGWPETGLDSSDELIKYFYENKNTPEINKIFWIGANTHPSRMTLKKIAEENPEIFDVSVMEWNRANSNKLKSKTIYVSLPDHAKYKYLIDCPGYGYSARLKWLLASGRPVFMVERDSVEWWHKLIKPFEHYIPVKVDLSDLLDKYNMIENDPALYEKISANAKKFAIENLLLDKQIDSLFGNYKNEKK